MLQLTSSAQKLVCLCSLSLSLALAHRLSIVCPPSAAACSSEWMVFETLGCDGCGSVGWLCFSAGFNIVGMDGRHQLVVFRSIKVRWLARPLLISESSQVLDLGLVTFIRTNVEISSLVDGENFLVSFVWPESLWRLEQTLLEILILHTNGLSIRETVLTSVFEMESKQVLSQTNLDVKKHHARYSFIMTNYRRIDINGNLDLSASIPWTSNGTVGIRIWQFHGDNGMGYCPVHSV